MNTVKLAEGVYWVGAVDWDARYFHGHTFSTHHGTTYNAYLVIDEKIALVDTVFAPFAEEMIERIKQIIDPQKIDYVIANHVEVDHSGSLPKIMSLVPNARLVCNVRCKEGLLKHYFTNWDFQIVKTGDKINLGKKSLSFLEAPMLHWPDSMFTYIEEDQLLLPNDAFGQHLASSERFDDEIEECRIMDEAEKYYANILMPLGSIVIKKIEEILKLGWKIKMIGPSHGLIWRKNPQKIIDAYLRWGKGETKEKVIIVFDSMYDSTGKMARAIAEGIQEEKVEVKIIKLSVSDRSDVIKEVLEVKGILVGSATVDNDMLPDVFTLLGNLKGLKPKNKVGGAFGSFGWSGGAVKNIESMLQEIKIEIFEPGISFKYVPTEEELNRCFEFGRRFAKKIKESKVQSL
ncbi:MAG: flavodoxin domain-containing protein [candidate division Zixibacteria bacterium]|nr:flavodoxin domain-containing protein [candidate division Zixibacteria bacterium]